MQLDELARKCPTFFAVATGLLELKDLSPAKLEEATKRIINELNLHTRAKLLRTEHWWAYEMYYPITGKCTQNKMLRHRHKPVMDWVAVRDRLTNAECKVIYGMLVREPSR